MEFVRLRFALNYLFICQMHIDYVQTVYWNEQKAATLLFCEIQYKMLVSESEIKRFTVVLCCVKRYSFIRCEVI